MKTPIQDAPASEAAPDAIRTCWMRAGDRVGISGVLMMLQVDGDMAKLVEERASSVGHVRAGYHALLGPRWTIADGPGQWRISHDRFTKAELRGETAIRLSPDGATWRVEIDAPPMSFMQLPTYPSGGAR